MPNVIPPTPGQPSHSIYRLVIGLFAALACSTTWARDIHVFTDRHHPITAPADVHVIELDAPARLEAELTSQLPTDPNRATTLAKQRLAHTGEPLQQQLAAAYQDVVEAWRLGVAKLPAVVVDQRHVVYGEPDVVRAVAKIETYRGQP